ncbi:GDSL esterase/lipase At3g14820 [Linum perenne]
MLISFTCFSPFPLSFHISPFAGCFRIPLSKLARPLQCPVLCLWTTATILPNHLSIMARMILFCSVVVIMIMVCDAAMAPPRKVPAMLIFGDSILDSGNNNYVNTIVKCNFQPYGRDFVTRKPTGRFCNGKVPSDFAVSFLGLKDLLPPSLDPTLTIRDLATGVSFASGGSGYDPETARGASVLTMSDQLEMFKEYKSKIEKGMGGKTAAKIVSESAYLIGVGSDDLVNTYFPSPIKRQQYDVQSYTDLMATYATSFYEELYMLGARRIGVLSLPPVGCLPSQRTVGGGLYRNCSDTYNQAAQLFNSKLSSLLQSLSLKHPDGLFVYLDVYDRLTSMVQNPAQYGFEVVAKGCCGTGNIEVSILCTALSDHLTCKDASKIVTARQSNNGQTVPAVFVFGDSLVDTGNNNYIPLTIAKSNFPPYGRDFSGGFPTGRFSNGRSVSDFIAEIFGVKELLPPYLDPLLDIQQLLTGVSFASSGAGYDPHTSQLANAIPITTQLDFLRRYIGRMNATVGEERTAYIVSQSAYITLIGSNDVSNMYPLVENFYDEDTYTDHMLNLALDFYQELYKLGARRIGLLTLPPTGCVPAIRVLNGGPTRGCYESLNRRVKLFNSKLSWAVDKLNNELPGAKFVLFDLYNPVLNLIQNPAPYGIEVVSRGCCGTGTVEVAILCIVPGSCTDANKYLFWDSYHPTEKASQILVHQVLAPHLNKLLR